MTATEVITEVATETATAIATATTEQVYLEEISNRLATNEQLMTYILCFLIVFFLYGSFKFFSKYLDMFF